MMTAATNHAGAGTNEPRLKQANPIPPWNRLAVDARSAATMFSIGRSTFFARAKRGDLPRPANDGPVARQRSAAVR